jgi:hypothetical protein
MTNPIGNELVKVIGISETGGLSAVEEFFTTQQIANLSSGGGGSGIIHEVDVTSGTSGTASVINTILIFNSATAGAKTANIPASTGSLGIIIIFDMKGTAGTDNIGVNRTVLGVNEVYTNFGSITLIDTSLGWLSV